MRHLYIWVLFIVFSVSVYSQGLSGKAHVMTPSHQDTCRVIAEYVGTQKVLEGMICNGKREGVWQVWSAAGRLKDSAIYSGGLRADTSTTPHPLTSTFDFRGHPKAFFKDSTYECNIQVNAAHGVHEIRGVYAGISDTIYPPLFYFGADLGARDAYRYYFIPKTVGKYKLSLSLTGEAGKAMGTAPFYEQEIEVKKK